MAKAAVITAPTEDEQELHTYWASVFDEVPRCTAPGCDRVAVLVDSHFPYLDDYNRCARHKDVPAAESAPQVDEP